jgi:transcriptional regulator with XRE-family HTH domain
MPIVNLKKHRKLKALTQFSDAAEVDTRTIRRIIKGEQNPTILVLRKLAKALEVEVSELIKQQ